MIAEALEDVALKHVHRRVVRVQLLDEVQLGQGPLVILELQADLREMVAGHHGRAVQEDGALEGLDRVFEPAGLSQHHAQADVGVGEVGVELDGLAEVLLGAHQIALGHAQLTQHVEDLRVGGVELSGQLEALERAGVLAQIHEDARDRHQGRHLVGVGHEGLLDERQGAVVVARFEQGHALDERVLLGLLGGAAVQQGFQVLVEQSGPRR
ncbi:hypothetical protein D3C72_586680 [compost metagenome]